MAKQRPPWFVRREEASIPYAFFLSHVAEDGTEVRQLAAEIHAVSGRGGAIPLACFLDMNNWPIGNVNTQVIKEYLLKSSHMVAWVTPAYLQNIRGWVWMELAYAELIELSLNLGLLEAHHPCIVPVFRGVTLEQVERTPWLRYWQRQLIFSDQDQSLSVIARKLVDFHEQERRKRSSVE